MIYLSRQLTTADGVAHSMAGIFPFAMEMTGRLQQFGYVTVELTDDCLLGTRGTVIRGHSFHYSRMVDAPGADTHYRVHYSLSDKQENEGYGVGNVLASYIHLHLRAAPAAALYFVEAARKMQGEHSTPFVS
jgi:cobyrinic acid a,c-diamide synthase